MESTGASYYPPAKFYFSASVSGISSGGATKDSLDCNFEEISGIEVEFTVDEVSEGGGYTYRLPKALKYPPLMLKRGVVTIGSPLGTWVSDTFNANLATRITPKTILVNLFGAAGNILMSWTFYDAFPLKWRTDAMNSTANEVLTESLEFSYSFFIRTIPS